MKVDYSKAFIEGRTVETDYGPATLRTHNIGELSVPTGLIVACDPFVFFDSIPFTTKIPPGSYPVLLSVERRGTDERVAFALLQISREDAVRWELAVRPDQSMAVLKDDEFYGYPVDSGTGCFMDCEAAKVFLKKLEDEVWTDDYSYSNQMMSDMKKNYVHTWDWGNFELEGVAGNLIAFTSGLGDGLYPSYFGFDAYGNVTGLVTDFGFVDLERLPFVSPY